VSCIITTDCNITENSPGVLCPVALTEGFQVLGQYQDWSSGHCHLETFESFLLSGILAPGSVRTSEVEEGSSYGREILDKVTVEINKVYKDLYVGSVFQNRPIADSGNFYEVHHNFVLRNDQSEVFNLPPVELTFLWTEE